VSEDASSASAGTSSSPFATLLHALAMTGCALLCTRKGAVVVLFPPSAIREGLSALVSSALAPAAPPSSLPLLPSGALTRGRVTFEVRVERLERSVGVGLVARGADLAPPPPASSSSSSPSGAPAGPLSGLGANASCRRQWGLHSSGRTFYKGGFEDKMSRKEASLILGVRESADPKRVQERRMLSNMVRRIASLQVFGVWRAWVQRVAELKQSEAEEAALRQRVSTMVRRMASGKIFFVWRAWAQHVEELQEAERKAAYEKELHTSLNNITVVVVPAVSIALIVILVVLAEWAYSTHTSGEFANEYTVKTLFFPMLKNRPASEVVADFLDVGHAGFAAGLDFAFADRTRRVGDVDELRADATAKFAEATARAARGDDRRLELAHRAAELLGHDV
jgi:hypothetical protein